MQHLTTMGSKKGERGGNSVGMLGQFLSAFTLFVFMTAAFTVEGWAQKQIPVPSETESPTADFPPYLDRDVSVLSTTMDLQIQGHQVPEAHYTARNTGSNELSEFRVRNIRQDSRGRIYILTGYFAPSIDVYDGTNWWHIDIPEDLPGVPNTMAEDADGNLWFATGNDVYIMNSNLEVIDSVKVEDQAYRTSQIGSIVFDGNGDAWMSRSPSYDQQQQLVSPGGIYKYSVQNDTLMNMTDALNFDLVPSLKYAGIPAMKVHVDGNIWVTAASTDSTTGGVGVFSPSMDTAWSYQTDNSDLPTNNASRLTIDASDRMWTCFYPTQSDTTVGAAYFDGSAWTSFTATNSPLNSGCRALEAAGQSVLDVGVDQQVYYSSSDTLMVYDGSSWSEMPGGVENHPLTAINSIIPDFNGKTLFGKASFLSSGVFVKDGSNWSVMSSVNDGGLFSDIVFGSTVDNNGNAWFSGFHGVTRLDGSNWTYYGMDDGLAYTYAWKVHAASNGTIWFGTTSNGVTYLKDGQFTIYNEHETFYGESIFEDSQGNIWMGSFGGKNPGVLRYDGTSFTLYDTSHTAINVNVTSFAEDANGNIIAASHGAPDGGSMAKFDTATGSWTAWQPDTTKQIFSSEIASDANGNVWIPADSLYRWDGSQLESFAYPTDNFFAIHVEVDPEGNPWFGSQGAYVLKNGTWYQPLESALVYDISHAPNGDTWMGTFMDGVYKFNRGEATAIANTPEQPSDFVLEANYPNPFNPTTNIRYQLPKAADVQLTVYNVVGRKVATLVNSKQQAGHYNVTFDASSLASGVYIYRLQTEGFSQTRKMLLVK